MVQKVIKIGSSAGVTIPKKQLDELGIAIGDDVEVVFKIPAARHKKFAEELDRFMDIYDQDLKNLAKR